MIVQIVCERLLTKDNLYNEFYRANTQHKINRQQKPNIIRKNIHSGDL